MRIASILTLTAALALPATAFATPKAPKKDPAPTAQHKPVKHHVKKSGDATPAPVTPAPATPAPSILPHMPTPAPKTPAK